MESSESRRLLPGLFGDVIVRHLAQSADLAGRTVRCDPCGKMAWTERVQIDTIVKWITDSEVRAALVGAGKLCIPHLLDVMSAVPWALVAELSSMAIDQLTESTADDLITTLTRSDPDLSRRAPHLPSTNDIRLQSDKLASTQSTLDRVLSGVERGCCAVCRIRAQGRTPLPRHGCSTRTSNGSIPASPGYVRLTYLDASVLDEQATQQVAEAMRSKPCPDGPPASMGR